MEQSICRLQALLAELEGGVASGGSQVTGGPMPTRAPHGRTQQPVAAVARHMALPLLASACIGEDH